jgi:sugar phosphate isomerase/epimerase
MRLAFTTLGCPEWDLDQIMSRAGEYGYDAVDFRGYLGEMELYKRPEFMPPAAAAGARKFAAAGLMVACFSSSARIFQREQAGLAAAVEEVKRYAELCGVFAARFIRVFGGAVGDAPRRQAVEIALAGLEKLAEAARPAILAVETHDDWVDTALLAELFRNLEAPNVCALWDVHHPYRLRGESPRESWKNIGPYTRYTHVKDSRRRPDGGFEYCLPGQGDVPLEEIVALLKADGRCDYLTLEWEKLWHPEIPGPEEAFPAYATYLRRLLRA